MLKLRSDSCLSVLLLSGNIKWGENIYIKLLLKNLLIFLPKLKFPKGRTAKTIRKTQGTFSEFSSSFSFRFAWRSPKQLLVDGHLDFIKYKYFWGKSETPCDRRKKRLEKRQCSVTKKHFNCLRRWVDQKEAFELQWSNKFRTFASKEKKQLFVLLTVVLSWG